MKTLIGIHSRTLATIGLLIALVGVVGGTLLAVFGSHLWGLDDAYISYRYAKNLAFGSGLVFNPGEYVEGFSNPLYVFLISLGLLFVSPDNVYALSMGFNILFIVAAVLTLYTVVNRETGQTAAVGSAILFAWHPEVWGATASGLETPLILLLHLLLWLTAVSCEVDKSTSARVAFVAVIVLEVLARIDGFIMPIVAVAFLVLRRRYTSAVIGFVALAIAQTSITIFRLVYFGHPLPNTYYTKVTGSPIDRIEHAISSLLHAAIYDGMFTYLVVSFIAIGHTVIYVVARRNSFREYIGMPVCIVASSLAYWIAVGGDVLGLRFVLPIIPASSALLYAAFRRYGLRTRWQVGATGFILICSLLHAVIDSGTRYPFEKRDGWIALGKLIHEKHPGAVLAIDAAGKVPYFSGLTIIDMLGLTDRHIARTEAKHVRFLPGHMKWDGQYVLSRKPDMISAFVLPNGDMPQVGISAYDCVTAGYRPKYLVSPDVNSPPLVVDLDLVPNLTAQKWLDFIQNDYDYLVVIRDGR